MCNGPNSFLQDYHFRFTIQPNVEGFKSEFNLQERKKERKKERKLKKKEKKKNLLQTKEILRILGIAFYPQPNENKLGQK